MGASELPPEPADGELQAPQGLLLTGEGLSAMTPERLQVLREMAGGLGLSVTVVGDLEALGIEEQEPEPVPVNLEDCIAFAKEHGYSRARVSKAWMAVDRTIGKREDPYPPVRPIGPSNVMEYRLVVDLRSVRDRLLASNMSPAAWSGINGRQIAILHFLAHFTNERLGVPDEERLPIAPQ